MANTTRQPVLLSLKPVYANKVFGHCKTVELRRRIASDMQDRHVFIYVTSPDKILRGGFRVGKVWHGTPEKVWHMVSKLAGINKPDFDTYFEGQNIAYALEITEIWKCQTPISLSALRHQFSKFVVPQSWRYVRDDEFPFLQQIERQTLDSVR